MENFLEVLVTCGGGQLNLQDGTLPRTISTIVNILKVAVPILVVLFGLIDLGKAVMSAKEDDIKKNQGLLIKRLIIAVLVFFVITLVQFLVSLVGGDKEKYSNCFDCFVNGECDGEKV